jgi:hypothetical protein
VLGRYNEKMTIVQQTFQQNSIKIISEFMEEFRMLSNSANIGDEDIKGKSVESSSLVCYSASSTVDDVEEVDSVEESSCEQKHPGIMSTFEAMLCHSGILSFGGVSVDSSADDISAVTEVTDSATFTLLQQEEPVHQQEEPEQQQEEPEQQQEEPEQQQEEPEQQQEQQQEQQPVVKSTKRYKTFIPRKTQWNSLEVNFPMRYTYKRWTASYVKNEKGGLTMRQNWYGEDSNIEYKNMNQAIEDMNKVLGRKSENNINAWLYMKTLKDGKLISMDEYFKTLA